MKILASVVFSFFAIADTLAQIDPKSLRHLEGLPESVILKKPVQPGVDQSTCNGFWFKKGYLCNKLNLIQYSLSDQRTMSDTLNKYIQLVNGLAIIANNSVILNPALNLEPTSISTFQNFLNVTYVNQLTKDAEYCWNQTSTMRSNALCSVCSADNYNYFYGMKAVLNSETCELYIKHCDNHFKDLATISGIMPATLKIFSYLRNLTTTTTTTTSTSLLLTSFSYWMFSSLESQTLISYSYYEFMLQWIVKPASYLADLVVKRLNLAPGPERSLLSAKICDLGLNIKNKSFIGAAIGSLNTTVTYVATAVKTVNTPRMLAIHSARRMFAPELGRRLCDKQLEFSPSDIAVLNPSSSILVVIDDFRAGASIVEANGQLPMNLSLTFP